MPPDGRRRSGSLLILLSLVYFLISTASAASIVVGIDIGTEYIKAALVKPGIPLEIVLTKDSKRKEAAAVAFKPLRGQPSSSKNDSFPERLYGGDALALSARFPGDVYLNLKPLLGLKMKSGGAVPNYGSWHPGLHMVEVDGRGTVGFRSESFTHEEEPFAVEELLAMELQNIKSNAEAFAGKGSTIQDIVITVPAYYTAEEKRAVEVAAHLAGLRVLAMTSDGLSVGLNYATSRTFPIAKGDVKPEYHLVYDMGAGSTTATVLRFQGKTVKDVGRFNKTVQEVQVLGVGWDKTLGGDAFNGLILEDMISKLADTTRIKALGVETSHIKKDGRTVAKLWKEAERIRQVLSANTEASSSFEGLYYEDVNFKYKLTRAEFEKLAGMYIERVRYPIIQATTSAKLEVGDLESVILHGGAVRTPFVQKELETIMGSSERVRNNVNSDEAACFGAAFKAAGISPSFKVKEIRAADVAAYTVGVMWVSDDKERSQKLFQPSSHVGTEKQVPFKMTEDFSFNLYQQAFEGVEQTRDIPVFRIHTQNLTASVKELTERYGCSAADVSTAFSIRLNPVNGLPEVTRGSVSCEVVEAKKGDFVDNVKGLFGFGSKKGEQEPISDELEMDGSTSQADTESPVPSSTTSSGSEMKSSETKATEKSKDNKKKVEIIYVGFSANETGLPQPSSSELLRVKERLASFDASDRSRKLREEALNTLEGYTYKVRDLVEDEAFVAASTEKERAEIQKKFKSASEWLYGDGADANRETLKERLKELRDLVDPIQKRREEASKRPQEVKSLMDSLNQTKALIDLVRQESEKAAEAAASVSSSASFEVEAQSTSTSTSVVDDGFTGLDDESSTTSTVSATVSKVPNIPIYTPEDLAELSRAHESVQKWLDEKLVEQEKLFPSDDPVILSSDLAAKSKQLNKVVMEVLQKKMQIPSRSKSSSKSRTSKTKSAKKTKTSKSSTTASVESAVPIETQVDLEDDTVKLGGDGDVKDEL